MSETAKRFAVVSSELPAPPYDAHVMANGYGFDLDVARMQNSDSWILCPPEIRPWMLMSWVISWAQHPCGSLPSDEELISARLGCSPDFLQVHRRFILRGWVLHADSRLYHPVVTDEVMKMIESREKWKSKKKSQRAGKQGTSNDVPGDTQGNPGGVHGVSRPSPSPSPSHSEAKASSGAKAPSSDTSGDVSDTGAGFCPHQDIIGLYHEILPELTTMAVSRWRGSQGEDHLRQRWREDARHQSLEFWERVFETVRGVPHWMGSGSSDFKADLAWIVQRKNFDKILNQMADKARREADSRTQAADAEARHG
jgi:hypothetical protein